MIVAEPGDPRAAERYDKPSDPIDRLQTVCRYVYSAFDIRRDLFHENLRSLIDECYPGPTLHEQLRRVWITESYLCSATREGDFVPAIRTRTCATF